MPKKSLALWVIQTTFLWFSIADFILVYNYPLKQTLIVLCVGILTLICILELERHKSHLIVPYSSLSKGDRFLRILKKITVILMLLFTFAGLASLALTDLSISMKTLFVNSIKSYGVILGLLITARWYWRIAYAIVAYFGIHSSLWVAYNF
jgi:hypothetical protein